jgi:hypothetical protein
VGASLAVFSLKKKLPEKVEDALKDPDWVMAM